MLGRFFDKRRHRLLLALSMMLGLVALLIGVGEWSTTYAQSTTPTAAATATRTLRATRTPTQTPRVSPTPRSTNSVTATMTLSPTATLTDTRATASPTATVAITSVIPVTVTVVVTVTSVATPTDLATATPTPTSAPPVVELLETEVLTGTILANRTLVTTTFFLEGQLYELAPLRSTGVALNRPLTALTLYNCEANTGQSECFWDPYPIRQNGFYEIVNGAEADAPLTLILEEASPPPTDQIWLQNRTGHVERFLYAGALYEMENSHVLELPLAPQAEGEAPVEQIYLRRCLGIQDRSVCEWLPEAVTGGIYYALVDETEDGAVPNSAITQIKLSVVLGEERLAALATPAPTETPAPEAAPTAEVAAVSTLVCQTQVPTLNIRSGPGLEYLVIGTIERSDPSGGQIEVVGRSAANDWLAVTESVAPGGWVVNSPQFIVCESGTEPLAVARVSDGRLAEVTPTPPPVAAVPSSETVPEDSEPAAEATTEEEASPDESGEGGIPPGRSMLIATNTFEHDIRFTLSAETHDLPEGSPSEYDLAPNQSVSFLIRAGRVQFSVSTPFRGGSGNAEFFLDEGATRQLFLRFVPNDQGDWELQWE